MNERMVDTSAARFERRISQLLQDYALLADGPLDAIAVASSAIEAAPRVRPWAGGRQPFGSSLRYVALALVLVGVLAALLGGVLVLGVPELPLPDITSGPRFGPGQMVASVDGHVVRMDLATGRQGVIADGWVLAMSPNRTRFIRATAADLDGAGREGFLGPLVITDAAGNDIQEIPSATRVATWSPDGRFIALAGLTAPDSSFAVWDTETRTLTRLPFASRTYLDSPDLPFEPTWAPDSRHLLVLDQLGSVVTDTNGDTRQPVVAGASGLMYWSPDGRYMLRDPLFREVERRGFGGEPYSSTIGGPNHMSLRSIHADLTSEEIARVPFVLNPSWSPDSRQFAGVSAEGVVVVSLDDPGVGRLVYRTAVETSDPAQAMPRQFVQWSPDGRQLAFFGWDDPDAVRRPVLLVVDTLGTGETRVVLSLDRLPPLGAFGLIDW